MATPDKSRVPAFAADLDTIERRLMNGGFFVAARGINRAKQALGWEAAGEVVLAGDALNGKRSGEKE